ncbi:DNA-directed RNA polymerase specialized sigma subunit [Candidatus Moduliflexus flocculans]|uniref:DNA-directed RNA polymerase specialized sigma subunit n=1 Tax=Candidatus Moduliflexus flocculans TaxID=1499966 RepID=A0A0S6VX70_9BACT|nr:DNA-directed RNA polymerase specialized sigma subunit [Candidatus Moduliflexus flocculans]
MKKPAQDWQALWDMARNGARHADQAFGELFQGYLLPEVIEPYARKMLGDGLKEAEDIAQEVAKKLLEGQCYAQPRMATLAQLKGYVWRMTHNSCVNMLSQKSCRRFAVTAQALEHMRTLKVPPETLARLQAIDAKPVSKPTFLKAIRKALGTESLLSETAILNACELKAKWKVSLDNVHLAERFSNQAEMETRERETIDAIYQTLTKDEREMLDLRFFQELTLEEIAQRLNTQPSTADSRLKSLYKKIRANQELRACWDDYLKSLNLSERLDA